MSKTIKKAMPWLLIFSLVFAITLSFNFRNLKVEADSADTSVNVENTVPAFTVDPYEDPASATSTPTNVGDNVTFKATATDANGDDWKLLICSTNSVTTLSCDGDTFCTSDFASSTAQATCSYTALVTDTETEDWYGFACDATGCSAESHNAGADIGPPFHVNHSPAFTVFADDGPKGPATTITWSTTASDPDSGGSDTVSLYVCKADDFTGSACGSGGTWCSDIATSSNPTCNATTPRPDGDYTAYGYVVDSHGLVSVDTAQGTDSSPTVTNSAPSITNSSINLLNTDGTAGNLTLTSEEAETAGFIVTFIVNDENSCMTTSSTDEITSAFINVRMSEKAQDACDIAGEYDANDCYPDNYASWNPVCAASSTVDACTDSTDTTVGWACTFPLQYHADPTVTGTPKATYNWLAAAQAIDDNGLNSGLVDGTGTNEMDTFMSYDLNTTSIAYGAVAPEADSAEKTTIVEATGNVGLDEMLSGSQLCNDYPTCAGGDDIAIAQQVYNLSQGLGWEGAGAVALSATSTEAELDCAKTTVTGTPATANTYWYLRVPLGQGAYTYTGENTIEGKVDNENYGA